MLLSTKGEHTNACHQELSTAADTAAPDMCRESAGGEQAGAKLMLSHTPAEHQLYRMMLDEVAAARTRVCAFSLRQFMTFTRLPNYSAIRRGLNGLINKRSIERYKVVGGVDSRWPMTVYFIFTPDEVIERRASMYRSSGGRSSGAATDYAIGDDEPEMFSGDAAISRAIDRLAEHNALSRREAQVALCCAKGLTNSEIGKRLFISEQTVKFHLRHIFVKYGVRRRTELISQLLSRMNETELGAP